MTASLAELPLMLADVPQVVARMLRDVGLPTRDWDEPVPPGGAVGRFVLVDSRHRDVSGRMRRAAAESQMVLDVRDLAGRCDDLEEPTPGTRPGRRWSSAARRFVERLKQVLESRGGVWARLTDFPHPYRSALCVAVEYPPELSAGGSPPAGSPPTAEVATEHAFAVESSREPLCTLSRLVSLFGPHTTHLLPLALPPLGFDRDLGEGDARPEFGWRITREDWARSSRRTLAAWREARARWNRLGLVPHSLFVAESGTSRRAVAGPSPQSLLDLGLPLRLQREESGPWVGAGLAGGVGLPWVDLGLAALPAAADAKTWVADLYRAGQPMMVLAQAGAPELEAEWGALRQACHSCSLLWRTSLAEWAHWWTARRGVEFAVWRTPTGHVVRAPHPLPPGDWGWELWRGHHYATLPLSSAAQSMPEHRLPLGLAADRHPGGLSVPRAGAGTEPVPSRPRWRGLKEWLHSLTLFRDQGKGVVP
jgi:hypothetical protein